MIRRGFVAIVLTMSLAACGKDNPSTSLAAKFFSPVPDRTPPIITSGPSVLMPAAQAGAMIALTTDEPTTSLLEISSDPSSGYNDPQVDAAMATYHYIKVSSPYAVPGVVYYRVRCINAAKLTSEWKYGNFTTCDVCPD